MHYRIEIRHREWHHPDCESLRRLCRQETFKLYGDHNIPEPTPESVASDRSVFVIAYLYLTPSPSSGAEGWEQSSPPLPVGCAGLRKMSPATDNGEPAPGDAELKKMFVRREYRGQPWRIARKIIEALEQCARERGWYTIVLGTGFLQPAAKRLYQREGYRPIPIFAPYTRGVAFCFRKRLDGCGLE
ncbi:acyl-CoA N-acyltransferase [Aspergillus ambiguus]|uniref:GNAT family N-acetyltransferase n=1 Tax=Aspergillus ambiguus TaxID=176160 RepID=UPI003CCCCBF3